MNGFKTYTGKCDNKVIHCIEFTTDNLDNYKAMEDLARKFVDGKPQTNFDRVTQNVETLAEFLKDVLESNIDCDNCFLYLQCSGDCQLSLKEWLQQRCEE